ncbi:hypothetical protein [Brevundimonas subvibrioides]|uniref:hypothetical protein n=1 Tax=Brevundimonas subvibrioides TaxID=74313 RepID=UPI0022B38613|nr:hypothetical protein [Brevundimonas subvibrioides]
MGAQAETAVKDVVVWTKHVHGDRRVTARLQSLKGGEDLELVVDGVRGLWRKMADGVDGRPTSGLRPVGRMQTFWKELYASRRGETVVIELPGDEVADAPLIYPADPDPKVRAEALQALLTAGGGHSRGERWTRDELYDL